MIFWREQIRWLAFGFGAGAGVFGLALAVSLVLPGVML